MYSKIIGNNKASIYMYIKSSVRWSSLDVQLIPIGKKHTRRPVRCERPCCVMIICTIIPECGKMPAWFSDSALGFTFVHVNVWVLFL